MKCPHCTPGANSIGKLYMFILNDSFNIYNKLI